MDLCRSPWCLCYFAISLILLLGSMMSASASGKRRCTLDDYRAGAPKQGFICGKMIPRTLSLVCGGSYRSPDKRDISSYHPKQLPWHYDSDEPSAHQDTVNWADLDTPVSAGDTDDQEGMEWDSNIFLPRQSALSYLRHRRSVESNYRTGVYCECCVHLCQYREMQAYCVPGNRDKRDLTGVTSDLHGMDSKASWWTNLMMGLSKDHKAASHNIS